ncbi:MAG: Sec-independent protein translocase subunit TatA/TatB [Bacteroidota bacterium]
MTGSLLFISGQEIIVVILIALLLFGSKEIPRIAKTIGKGMNEFRKATDDIKREFDESTSGVTNDLKDFQREINKDTSEITNNIKKSVED